MENLIKKLSKILLNTLIIFCALQIITYQTIDVVIGCCVSLITCMIFCKYILTEKSLKQRPVSFVAIIGVFLFTYFAPIMTFVEGHPITYNMISPVSTFLWQLLYVLVTFAAYIYTGRKIEHGKIRQVLQEIGYFDSVGNTSLWILGLLGVAGRIYLLKNQFGEEATRGAGTIYLLFIPFLMAPYCILFRPILSRKANKYRGSLTPFIVYTLALLVMAIASNARNSMVTIILTLLLMAIFYCINYREDITNRILNISLKKILLCFLAFLVFSGPISDIAIAMVAVRYMRSDIDAKELFAETINLAMDSEKMKNIKSSFNTTEDNSEISSTMLRTYWNESYVSNVFMNRVCNYQVADASIYHAFRAGVPCQSFINDCLIRIKLLFPKPIVELLFGDIDKEQFNHSPMDFLYAQSMRSQVRNGHIVGGDVGLGLAVFGYFFPLFQFVIYILIFRYMDSIIAFDGQKTIIPFLTFISIYGFFFTFFVGNGILARLTSFFWAIPFGIIVKVLMVKIVKKFFG